MGKFARYSALSVARLLLEDIVQIDLGTQFAFRSREAIL